MANTSTPNVDLVGRSALGHGIIGSSLGLATNTSLDPGLSPTLRYETPSYSALIPTSSLGIYGYPSTSNTSFREFCLYISTPLLVLFQLLVFTSTFITFPICYPQTPGKTVTMRPATSLHCRLRPLRGAWLPYSWRHKHRH